MRQIVLLAFNDFRLTFRDRSSFVWMLLMPVAMMWFLGNLGGGSSGPPSISLSVVNHDDGWLSRALIEELNDEQIVLRELTAQEATLQDGLVRSLVIPEGFTRGVLSGEQQVLRLERQPDSDDQFSLAAQAHIFRAIVRATPRLIEMHDSGPTSPREDDVALEEFRALAARPALVQLDVSTAGRGRPVPSGRAQSVPGTVTMMVLMMTLIYGGVFLAMEREQGMLRRQAVLPLSRSRLLAGKVAGRLIMAAFQMVVLLLAGRFLFGVSWGRSPAGMILLLVAYAVAVAALATLLGAVARTPAQASAVGWIGSMVLAAVGGCWWPSEVMPGWMWSAAHVLPTAWAMDAFHALISFGRGFEAVLVPSLVLLGFGAVFLVLAARFLRVES